MPTGAIPYYWRLSSFYFFYFAVLGVMVPYWSLYLKGEGYPPAEIGLLLALPQLTKLVAPNIWGYLADKTGQRVRIINIGNLVAACAFAGVFWADNFWRLAAVLILFSFFWNAVISQFEVVTMDVLSDVTDDNSHRYSHVRVWGSIGFIITAFVLGQLLEIWETDLVPWVLLILLWLIWFCTWIMPAGIANKNHHEERSGLIDILKKPEVIAFLICAFLMQMSHGPYYAFFSIYLEQLDWSRRWVGFLWALGVAAEVVVFMVMHRFLGVFSLERLLQLSLAFAAVRWLLLGGFADNLAALLVAQLLHAASFGIFHAASIPWVHRAFGGGHQGQGQAFYSSVGFGAGWACGAVLSGFLWQGMGGDLFYWAALVAIMATLIALRIRPLKSD